MGMGLSSADPEMYGKSTLILRHPVGFPSLGAARGCFEALISLIAHNLFPSTWRLAFSAHRYGLARLEVWRSCGKNSGWF